MSPRTRRLVVIGNGMAGARLVEEVAARDPDRRWQVTVVGDEPTEAYNRILLSGVLAGTHREDDLALAPPGAWEGSTVRVLDGTRVSRVHRSTRTVHLADGRHLGYDRLVLATGSTPVVPPLPGLLRHDPTDPERGASLHPQAFAFRTLDDCRRIVAATAAARRAVVVGGGLLGLEAARGIAARGVPVEVVQMPDRLMDGQLDAPAATILRRRLSELGITVYLGTRATQVLTSHGSDGALVGVRLADRHVLECDLLVFAVGVRPSTRLAREARLRTARGIVVDRTLTSPDDPAVHAVGDCAEVLHPDGSSTVGGLVQPAWEQASALASTLTATPDVAPTTWQPHGQVTRLKAGGIDLAAMGDVRPAPEDSDGDLEVLQYSDPSRGVYAKAVLRGGRVVGGILLGDLGAVGPMTLAFDRGSPVPPDRRHLLFGGAVAGGDAAGAALGAADLPDDATLCHCNDVDAGTVRAACRDGARDVAAVAACTRATTGCGTCAGTVRALLATATTEREEVRA